MVPCWALAFGPLHAMFVKKRLQDVLQPHPEVASLSSVELSHSIGDDREWKWPAFRLECALDELLPA